jgi:hypothetical protein
MSCKYKRSIELYGVNSMFTLSEVHRLSGEECLGLRGRK